MMYKFAEYLTYYMNKNNISYRKAAIAINIDRTQLRRYVVGERLPKNEEIVKSIAEGIDMSEEESCLLFQYYKRSKMGEQKYRWYKTIGKILNENLRKNEVLRADRADGKDNSDIRNTTDMGAVEKISMETGRQQVVHCQKSMSDGLINISKEEEIERIICAMCHDAKQIKIMLQTRIYHFYDRIYEAVRHNDNCFIEHIVQLNNINSSEDISDIKIFEKVYQLIACGASYKGYYTYNNYNDNIAGNYIITDKGLLLFNTFEGRAREAVGIYTEKKEIVLYYTNKFRKLKSKSYVYGYSGKDTAPQGYSIQNILESKKSGMTVGIYKTDLRQGVWIRDSRKHGRRDVYIEEENIVYNFSVYANDYYSLNKK